MNIPKVHVSSFAVVGIAARTTNAREMNGDGVIDSMWARVVQEKLLAEIPYELGSDTVALYIDYESDRAGAYTYLLGVKVSSVDAIPPGFVAHKVPAGDYAELQAVGTSAMRVTVELWQKLWSLEDSRSLKRTYETDFEIHPAASSPGDGESRVMLYVGLRN